MFANQNWTGNLYVTKGEHLKLVDDKIGVSFWLTQRKKSKKEGAVLSHILMKCTEHGDRCVVARESFDPFLYATFMSGDKLDLNSSKSKDGWLYGTQYDGCDKHGKSCFLKNDPSGYSVSRNAGYIHPSWVSTPEVFLGFIASRIFSTGLMAFDVVTDYINGYDYIGVDKLPYLGNNTICDNLQNYQHPIWGSVAIGLSWMPGIPIFVYQIAMATRIFNRQFTLKEAFLSCLSATLILLFWPITSIWT